MAPSFSASASQAIGYREVCAFLDGELSSDVLVSRVRSNTHRLVRRQETWFRRMRELRALPVEDERRDASLFELAEDVLLHRIRPTYEALARGRTGEDILRDLLAALL